MDNMRCTRQQTIRKDSKKEKEKGLVRTLANAKQEE
jgi:hypothetical protein